MTLKLRHKHISKNAFKNVILSKTTSQTYFEKRFQNKEIEWKCIYLIPGPVTIDTNLRIFQNL